MKRRLPVATLVAVLLLGLLPYFGVWAWSLDMLNHFRPQLAVVALAVVLVAWGLVRKRWMALGLIGPALLVAPMWFALKPGPHSVRRSVVHVNVGGCDPAAVADWLSTVRADAAFLLEVRPEDEPAKTPPPGWYHAVSKPSSDTRGVVVLLRDGVTAEASTVAFTVPQTTRVMAVLSLPTETILQAHLARPGSERGFAEQRDMSRAIAGWSAAVHRPVVVGDFNAAPWSGAVQPLRAAGLRPASGGLAGTWPAYFPAGLRVPIDHAFGVVRTRVTVGPDLGGDHRPIIVDIGE